MVAVSDELKDRVAGALLFAACGDGLGAAFEGRTLVTAPTVSRHLRDIVAPLRWTDDTSQMIVLSEHLTGHASTLGNDATALGSVPSAIAVFLRSPDQPMKVIEEAIGLGGDTDTIAAMASAISGALAGGHAVPQTWLNQLEGVDRLRLAAAAISALW